MAKKKNRLTKAEVFLCLGVVLFLVSLVGPVLWSFRLNAVERMVREDFFRVEGAVKYFVKHYSRAPSALTLAYDFRYGLPDDLPNRHIMNVLRAVEGEGNVKHEVNPERQPFNEFEYARPKKSGLSAQGDLLDPWGRPYQMVLDLDGNRICDLVDSIYDRAFGKQIAVWSYGADGRANTVDDLLSWVQ